MNHYPTITDIKKSACAGRNSQLIQIEEIEVKSKPKYGNKKSEFDGYTFDSLKELRYYVGLRMLCRSGQISNLRLQVPYELNPGGTHSLKYVADFVYVENGKEVVVDVKGFRTIAYKKKRALMLKVHGIVIKEV